MDKSSNLRNNTHAVIIGINKYQDKNIHDLDFARADAEAVYQVLTDPKLGRIPRENVILLLDDKATLRNIRVAIGTEIPRKANENDLVYIYYAGHGSPVIDPKGRSRDGMEKYLIPTDAEMEHLRATGISMDEIQKFFGWIESKQVMFFIDSCYSGEAGGRTFQQHKTRHLSLSPEFLDRLVEGEGRLVVTACDVNEVSLETPDIGHGLFTYYLIEGLKGVADKDQDGLVDVHELYEYVYENVSKRARELGGSMHPIQKGSIKGKIFLTEYENKTYELAKSLNTQAQSFYDSDEFDKAYDLWQQVIKLVPDHEHAKTRIAAIDKKRLEELNIAQTVTLRKAIKYLIEKEEKLTNLFSRISAIKLISLYVGCFYFQLGAWSAPFSLIQGIRILLGVSQVDSNTLPMMIWLFFVGIVSFFFGYIRLDTTLRKYSPKGSKTIKKVTVVFGFFSLLMIVSLGLDLGDINAK
jgi:hypothetical protein